MAQRSNANPSQTSFVAALFENESAALSDVLIRETLPPVPQPPNTFPFSA